MQTLPSQTPLIAWTIWGIYRQEGDRSFLRDSLPGLVAFHDWFDRERDIDGDRLIELGSYGQEERQPRMETIDLKQELDELAVRNDAGGYWAHWGRGKPGIRMSVDRLLVTNRNREPTGDRFYANVELVESTAAMILMEKSLVDIARELDEGALEARFRRLAAEREAAMNERMWDAGDGFYYDLHRDTRTKMRTKGWGQFFPLISRSASDSQAREMVRRLTDQGEFWPAFPVSLHSKDDLVDQSHDLRDTSVAVNYLISIGLNNYGYHELARKLTDSTVAMVDESTCAQRYASDSGKQLGGSYEAAAAMVLPMICQNCYGVQSDWSTLRVPDDARGGWLRWGTLLLDFTEPGELRVKSETDRTFQVLLADQRQPAAFSLKVSAGAVGVVPLPTGESQR